VEIITKQEQKIILKWIHDNRDKFNINECGKNRKFISLRNIYNTPKIIFEIKKRILINENITEWDEDPFFGDLITCNTHGGFIHNHTDPTLPNKTHLRFNLFLSKPIWGGDPIYNNEKLKFKERTYIKYNVNQHYHSSTSVLGFKPRIAISYGISIS
jgi:hypothetical protein